MNNPDKGLSTEPLVIHAYNSTTLQQLWDGGDFDKVFNSTTHWTRITVLGGVQYDKNLVLRTLMLAGGGDVFPALYQNDGKDSFFLARNCSIFIRKLALSGLSVPNPSGKNNFDLSITTHYLPFTLEPLDINIQLKLALAKRNNFTTKTLDLSNFSQDPYLKDIYFPLCIPQCMHLLNRLIRRERMGMNICTLVLQHNDLRSLEILDLKYPCLTEIDLRHNQLTWEGFEKLIVKREMKVKSIWLDGNPLCINSSEADYIKRIVHIIPHVVKIDGVDVTSMFINSAILKNFFHHGSWAQFTDHFLHHYFELMESPNRHLLARMYHQKATFSLSAYQNPEDTLKRTKLSNYMAHSRNLLTLSDITKAYTTLKIGPDEITEVLNSLPVLQFDRQSFTVDVPFSQEGELVLIDVGGIFQEMGSGLFYFHRSFVLTPFKKNPGEWKIETDMLSISPSTPQQAEKSFSSPRKPVDYKMKLKVNPSIKDKDALIPAVCELTKLTQDYAIRFLEEGSWDLNLTLQAFIDQLKGNQIPMSAFSI